jgi:hypothetical protein
LILFVAPKDVASLWSQLEDLVISALRGCPTHDADDVKVLLIDGSCQLFIQFDRHVEAIGITSIVTHPKGKWLNVWLVAAHKATPLRTATFLSAVNEFRKEQGCRGFQSSSTRPGWLKRNPSWIQEGVSLRWTESP